MKRTFKRGDVVTIFNRSGGGRFIVEGQARIMGPAVECDPETSYRVMFPDGDIVERYVDPAGQKDPQGYAHQLNEDDATFQKMMREELRM